MENRRIRQMIVTFIVGFLSLVAVVSGIYFVAGIDSVMPVSNPSAPDNNGQPYKAAPPVNPKIDLEGVWQYETDKGGIFEATVTSEAIRVLMKSPNGTSILYWNGSFDPQQSPGSVVVSDPDDSKAFLSQSKSKDFLVGSETLTFDYTSMGITKKVELRRV